MVDSLSSTRSSEADSQDRRWQEYVAALRAAGGAPFAEQWARFGELFAGRDDRDGPPLVWQPGEDALERSNLWALLDEVGLDDYAALHRWSVQNRAEFWRRAIDRLGIELVEPPSAIVELDAGAAQPRWLPGARLSIVDSCFHAAPDAVAIRYGGDDGAVDDVTCAELLRLVNRVANGLAEHGFEPGETIALYMPMTVECVAAYLGIVRAGLAVVSIADSFSPAEVRRRLAITGTRTVLTVASFERAGKTIRMFDKVVEAEVERAIVITADGERPALRAGDLEWRELLSDRDGYDAAAARDPYSVTNVLFSSGTTGEPKAIPWTQLTPLKCAMDGHFHHDIRPGDAVAWPTNIGWMMGPWLIYAALINRASVALYTGAPNGPGFTRFVTAAGVTVLGVVPALVRSWRAADTPGFDGWRGVRTFSSTGEPSNREDYLWLMSRAGYRAPVIEYLGGTEIGGGHVTGSVLQPASPATFTTPALGLDVVLLDDDGNPTDDSGEGEMYLVPPSIGLSQTLLNRDHDEVYYRGCPAGPNGEVLRRHGDQMARLAYGFYRAQGRADDTMNLGGIKVSSLELERVLGSHERVYEAAAVAVQPSGEGAEQLVVFAVLDGAAGVSDRDLDIDALRGELGALLKRDLNPLFKIYDLRLIDKLPRTASNKIMRRELRARYGSK